MSPTFAKVDAGKPERGMTLSSRYRLSPPEPFPVRDSHTHMILEWHLEIELLFIPLYPIRHIIITRLMDTFIYAKTTDGRDISLDGLKVESFSFHSIGKTEYIDILEIVFKSGQTVQVINDYDKDGVDVQSQLVEVMQTDRTAIPAPKEDCLTDLNCVDGREGIFISYAVDFLISYKSGDMELVELHFASGKIYTVYADSLVDESAYRRRNIVEDYIYRYEKEHSKA